LLETPDPLAILNNSLAPPEPQVPLRNISNSSRELTSEKVELYHYRHTKKTESNKRPRDYKSYHLRTLQRRVLYWRRSQFDQEVRLLKMEHPLKLPPHRVISSINPEQFKECFHQWVQGVHRELSDVITIDGKVLRGSFDKATEQSAIHMVSAFSTSTKLVLAHQKVDEKSNEITAIPKLLDMLMLKGAVVTMDCQKSITQNIIDTEGDYAIAVKGNQKKLHKQLKTHFNNTFDMQHHKK